MPGLTVTRSPQRQELYQIITHDKNVASPSLLHSPFDSTDNIRLDRAVNDRVVREREEDKPHAEDNRPDLIHIT